MILILDGGPALLLRAPLDPKDPNSPVVVRAFEVRHGVAAVASIAENPPASPAVPLGGCCP